MNIIEEIQNSWGWIGIIPIDVVAENDFGNLILKDVDGKYWRFCPEDTYCKEIASNHDELKTLTSSEEFLHDWYMKNLVSLANDRLGPLTEGKKYCLKVPAIMGGDYGGDNFGIINFNELIRFSGDIAKQVNELPDGTQVKLVIT
jgi:hypothetical protein